VNGQVIGDGRVPGPVTRRITQAYIDHVGTDFVAQYLSANLAGEETGEPEAMPTTEACG
jgi:hypothetical protein